MLREATGLSKPTTSQMIARLLAADLIRSIGTVPGKRGPAPTGYAPNPLVELGVAIDLSEGHVEAVLVDVLGSSFPQVGFDRTFALGDLTSPELAIAETKKAVVLAAEAGDLDPESVGHVLIAVPASVADGGDLLHLAGSLPPWPEQGLATLLSQGLGLNVHLGRDVVLAADTELVEDPSSSDFALLWIGWGVGLATVANSQVLQGSSGRAGEVGYLVPSPDSSPKDLQELLGASAVVELARQCAVPAASFPEVLDYLSSLQPDGDLDEATEEFLDELAGRIAGPVCRLIYVTDPGKVILGGPLGAAAGSLLADRVDQALRGRTLWPVAVEATRVGASQALFGARDQLREHLTQALLDRAAISQPS